MSIQPYSYALTSIDRVRRVRLTMQSENFDELLTHLINAVTDYIEGQCGRRFKLTEYTHELYRIHNCNEKLLVMRNEPVVEVSVFETRTGSSLDATWIDIDPNEWELLEGGKSGIIEMEIGLPKHVRVSYQAGYKIDWDNYYDDSYHTLPSDVSDLVERLVIREFKKRESEGKVSEGFDGAQINWKDGMDDIDISIINRYKRMPVLT